MKRQRVEDIGRILILVENVMEHELFTEHRGRPKDYVDWFYQQSPERQADLLRVFAYGLGDVEEKLGEIRNICRAEDDLNYQEPTNEETSKW